MSNTRTISYVEAQKRTQGNATSAKMKKRSLIITLIVVILFAALWIWKAIQINTIATEAKNKQEAIRSYALQAVMETNLEHLRVLAKPYTWAIRTEMMQGNLNQVNQYANEMIKEKNFQSIVVANQQGIVISSTNKKFEGKDFSMAGKPSWLTNDAIVVEKINNDLVAVSSPIMGYNTRLGTLLITYKVNIPELLQDNSLNKQ